MRLNVCGGDVCDSIAKGNTITNTISCILPNSQKYDVWRVLNLYFVSSVHNYFNN